MIIRNVPIPRLWLKSWYSQFLAVSMCVLLALSTQFGAGSHAITVGEATIVRFWKVKTSHTLPMFSV